MTETKAALRRNRIAVKEECASAVLSQILTRVNDLVKDEYRSSTMGVRDGITRVLANLSDWNKMKIYIPIFHTKIMT
jgi:hypothetical protein